MAGTRSNHTDRRGADIDWLVVGLGNPGNKFARTRHNVGQDTVALLAERQGVTLSPSRDHALSATYHNGYGDDLVRVCLAVPITFMNESGRAVAALCRRHGATAAHLIVVHDELDLEPGIVRIKCGGGLAGHNGLRSITQHLHTKDYIRVRIGVGKPSSAADGAHHVLSKVPPAQRTELDVAQQLAADAVESIIEHGAQAAMATFHAR